jgi:hypothetical protein
VTTPDDTQADWSEMCGSLPSHQDEIVTAHQGTPGTGIPAPAVDHGPPVDSTKYSGGI